MVFTAASTDLFMFGRRDPESGLQGKRGSILRAELYVTGGIKGRRDSQADLPSVSVMLQVAGLRGIRLLARIGDAQPL